MRELLKDKDDGKSHGSASQTFFSSQSEGETSGTEGKSVSSRRSRRSIAPGGEGVPKLIETLGLCYLGGMLLRLPVGVGEFHRWAAGEEMVYTRAVSSLCGSLVISSW